MTRAAALRRTLAALRCFLAADVSGAADASWHRGLYFHFLDMGTGSRCWKRELSSIGTAFLAAGRRPAALRFGGAGAAEREVHDAAIAHGWRPEGGFPPWRWIGYTIHGRGHVYAGPLFIHQYSHMGIDLRGVADRYMAARGIDYLRTAAARRWCTGDYARCNPRRFAGRDAGCGA